MGCAIRDAVEPEEGGFAGARDEGLDETGKRVVPFRLAHPGSDEAPAQDDTESRETFLQEADHRERGDCLAQVVDREPDETARLLPHEPLETGPEVGVEDVRFEALGSGCRALDQRALDALLAGIIYDSRRFLIFPETSIGAAARLVRLGSNPSKVLQLLTSEQDPSERIAKLKGATRLRLFRSSGLLGDWIVALTSVGSYEASVARAMTDLGADVAIVISANGKSVRVSARSTDAVFKKTDLNLARDLMKKLAESFPGQGGGHPTAASVNLKGDPGEIESRALSLISDKVGSLKQIATKK